LKGHGTSFDPQVNDDGRDMKRTGYITDILNEEALEFVNRKHDKPYCLYLSHKAIHPETYQGPDGKLSDPTLSNFIPAPRHRDLYEGAKIPRRKNYAVVPTDKPALMQKLEGVPPLSPETVSSDKVILNRLRMLAAVDEGLGQLLQALEKNGQLDNTLIAVAGDHGYFYGEHCLSVERRLAYEESIRIPLIMRYPPLIAAGSAPEPLVQTTDLAPTFVALGGGEAQPQYQGKSLVPLLKGEKPSDWRKTAFIEYYSDTVFPRVHKLGYKAVRTAGWKYIHYTDQTGMDELYNLAKDEYELHNLINDPASALPLKTMKAELDRVLNESAAK
jgi:N-acetylglucosamine-6-sulfatase